jgi:hypothetical protein
MNQQVAGRFRPRRADGRSAAQVLLDHVAARVERQDLHLGDVIPHDELLAALDEDTLTSTYYQAVGAATRLLQKQHGRSLQAVRGEGYRFIAGLAQLDKARGQQDGAGRRMKSAVATVSSVDEDTLSSVDERKLVRAVARGMAAVVQILAIQAESLAEHAEDIAQLKSSRMEDTTRQRATEAELAEVRERLARLEKTSPQGE